MGVFKEEIAVLEELAKQQVQIYPDSADFGILASKEVKDIVREVITNLLPLPGSKIKSRYNGKNYIKRSYELRVYWSKSDGTIVFVTYHNDLLKKKEFFSIDFRNFGYEE